MCKVVRVMMIAVSVVSLKNGRFQHSRKDDMQSAEVS